MVDSTFENLELIIRSLEPFMNKKFFDYFTYLIPSKINIKKYEVIKCNSYPESCNTYFR